MNGLRTNRYYTHIYHGGLWYCSENVLRRIEQTHSIDLELTKFDATEFEQVSQKFLSAFFAGVFVDDLDMVDLRNYLEYERT